MTEMNLRKTGLAHLVLMLLAIFTLTSCVEDDDWWTKDTLIGTWRVVEVNVYAGDCPYDRDDQLTFWRNGNYEAHGYSGFDEYGNWDISGDLLILDFSGKGHVVATIRQLDEGYMVLAVDDPQWGRYSLRLVRSY